MAHDPCLANMSCGTRYQASIPGLQATEQAGKGLVVTSPPEVVTGRIVVTLMCGCLITSMSSLWAHATSQQGYNERARTNGREHSAYVCALFCFVSVRLISLLILDTLECLDPVVITWVCVALHLAPLRFETSRWSPPHLCDKKEADAFSPHNICDCKKAGGSSPPPCAKLGSMILQLSEGLDGELVSCGTQWRPFTQTWALRKLGMGSREAQQPNTWLALRNKRLPLTTGPGILCVSAFILAKASGISPWRSSSTASAEPHHPPLLLFTHPLLLLLLLPWSGVQVYDKIDAGADVNFVFGVAYSCPEGYTPLMVAAHRGRLECAKALLRAGADPNYVNGAGAQKHCGREWETAYVV
eukprot:292322-Chlamydomonas_euryale.AAC.13